jgi:hypothetical protein
MYIGYIYKTTNLINNRSYIGKKQKEVFDPTYYGSGLILKEAIKKYGKENFSIEVLSWATTISELNKLEELYISQYRLVDDLYNIAKGGNGGDTLINHPDKDSIIRRRNTGLTKWHQSLTNEEKVLRGKKISQSKKGKSNGHCGLAQSKETIEKIRKGNIEFDRANNPEWKEAHTNAMAKRKGQPLTKKYKAVIINNIEYESVKHALVVLGIKHRATFYKLIKENKLKVIYK